MTNSGNNTNVPARNLRFRMAALAALVLTALLVGQQDFKPVDMPSFVSVDGSVCEECGLSTESTVNTKVNAPPAQKNDDQTAELDPLGLTAVLGIFLLLTILIEQGCEVLRAIYDGGTEARLATDLEISELAVAEAEQANPMLSSDDMGLLRRKSVAAKEALTAHKISIAPVATFFCIILASFAVLAGFQFVAALMEVLQFDESNVDKIRYFDAIITVLLLSGGADRYHQFAKKIFPSLPKAVTDIFKLGREGD